MLVESEVAMLIVHHDRMAELGKVVADLVQPSGFDGDPDQRDLRVALDYPIARQGAHRIAVAPRQRRIDDALIVR